MDIIHNRKYLCVCMCVHTCTHIFDSLADIIPSVNRHMHPAQIWKEHLGSFKKLGFYSKYVTCFPPSRKKRTKTETNFAIFFSFTSTKAKFSKPRKQLLLVSVIVLVMVFVTNHTIFNICINQFL